MTGVVGIWRGGHCLMVFIDLMAIGADHASDADTVSL